MIDRLIYEWRARRYWRRTICPHGNMYADGDCDRCPYPTYGYGRKVRHLVG